MRSKWINKIAKLYRGFVCYSKKLAKYWYFYRRQSIHFEELSQELTKRLSQMMDDELAWRQELIRENEMNHLPLPKPLSKSASETR